MDKKLAGLVLTYNGERLLRDCLTSLAFCDVLLVVDSGSNDTTLSIATECGATVLSHKWEGPAMQFHFALNYLKTHFPEYWVFTLDQDEICTQELQNQLQSAIKSAPADLSGFLISRKSWYYNRFLLHSGWYPDYLFRCFRQDQMFLKVIGAHESLLPKGKTYKLKGEILHYPYDNFRQHLEKINLYAEQGANDLRKRGVKGGIAAGLAHGFGRFVRIYVIKVGFLDGKAGFINAVHGAFYAFLKYVRIPEGKWQGSDYNTKPR